MARTFANPLARRAKSGYRDAIERIEAETRKLLRLPDEATVSVYDLSCCGPACPDGETVIAVMCGQAKPRVARVQGPIADISATDLASAVAQHGREPAFGKALAECPACRVKKNPRSRDRGPGMGGKCDVQGHRSLLSLCPVRRQAFCYVITFHIVRS